MDPYLQKLCDQLHGENTEKLRDFIAPPFTVEEARRGNELIRKARENACGARVDVGEDIWETSFRSPEESSV